VDPIADLDAKVQNETVTRARGAEPTTVGVAKTEAGDLYSDILAYRWMELRQQYIAMV
jgi:hypothetical protein